MNTLSGEVTPSKSFCLPSGKWSILKGKNLLPWGSILFPFRIDLYRRYLDTERRTDTLMLSMLGKHFSTQHFEIVCMK